MKVVVCDGETLEVRDVGAPLIVLRARIGEKPFKRRGRWLAEDVEARAELRTLIDSGMCERRPV